MKKREIPGMFQGSMIPLLLKLGLPVMTGMFFQFLFTLFDTLFVSRIDASDPSIIGGVGLVFPIMFIIIALSGGLMVGISSLVARSIGSNDEKTLNRTVESSLILALIFSVIAIIVGYLFLDNIIAMLGSKKAADYMANGSTYLKWIIPSLLFMLITHALVGVFQGEGRPQYMMISMMTATVVNLILDPMLIYKDFFFDGIFPFIHAGGIRMGVAGAALATTIAQVVGALVILAAFFKGKSSMNIRLTPKNISLSVMGRILQIGLPMFLAQGTMAIAIIFYNKILINIDEVAVSAFTFVGRMDQIVLLPSIALSSALVTVIGQNYGRGNYRRMRQAWRTGVIMGAIIVLAIATIHVLVAPFLYLKLTSGNVAITKMAVTQIRIMEFSFLGAVVGIQGRGVFQGLGKPLPSVILSILRTLIFGLMFILLFVYVFHLGTTGVYLGIVCGNVLISIVSAIWVEGSLSRLIRKKDKEEAIDTTGKISDNVENLVTPKEQI